MVTFSCGWVSKAAYWLAGLGGGAFLSLAKEGRVRALKVSPQRIAVAEKQVL